jgi:subtilisin-like proprotein convertase family protein
MNELRDILKGWHYTDVDQFYEPDAVTEDVINAVNEGRGFINYIGHGSTDRWVTSSFTSRDALALKNSRKWPFIVSVACVNGHFHGQESFAEAWLRSGTPEDPRGAIAMFASSTNQAWVEPLFGQREVIRELVNQETSTLGGLFLNGAIAVLESGMEEAAQTFETWHVFGDPTVMPRTQAPREIVGVTPKFVAGQTKFELKVDGKDITGALSQADQLVAVGTSDAKGRLVMKPIRPLRAGEATFVLTGVDRVARVETVNPRLSETAFLTSEDLRFNGRVETLVYPGERVEISGALRNIAEVPADLARVSLEVLSGPAIAVRASSETPRLASLGVVAWTPAEISFEVDPAARANDEIVLRLAWDVPGGQSGFEMLTLVVARAALKPSQAGLGEYVHGYYEGIRPGAEGNVSFSLINNGSEVIRHAVLRVVDGYSCVERSQGEVLVETLAPGARVDVSGLRIKIDELCVEGSKGVLRLEGTYMNGAQAPTALSVDIPFAVGADRIFSRVYEALALPIADGAAEPTNIALPIQGNGDVKEIQITLKIKHPCAADLDLTLVHPDGTEVSLKRPPGSPASDVNITWGKGGVPVEEFKKFLGKTVDGTWTLQVRDATKADLGILDSVRMLVWAD